MHASALDLIMCGWGSFKPNAAACHVIILS
jgi:hypothetical protein